MKHVSAKASHYDYAAGKYDAMNEKFIEVQNEILLKILRKHRLESVLDLTCSTGAQVIYLSKNGFKVVGSDINRKMLAVAKKKAKVAKVDCPLLLGDMRTSRLGSFDSVITIFNAIGHLTKNDFRSQKTVVGTQEERNRREKK
jgi:ubiquinone/menaquinone biosynthesis C-methylase UbiE